MKRFVRVKGEDLLEIHQVYIYIETTSKRDLLDCKSLNSHSPPPFGLFLLKFDPD